MVIKHIAGKRVDCSADAGEVLRTILETEDETDREKEHFWVIGLSTKNVIKFIELASLGTLDCSLIHPRETFRLAIGQGVSAIIVGHNHPSGDPAPSKDDIAITKRLKAAGEIIGIELLDHVIIGGKGRFVSLQEKGHL